MGESVTITLDSETAALMRRVASHARMSVDAWARAHLHRAVLIAAAAAEQHLTEAEFIEDAAIRSARKAMPAPREARQLQGSPSGTRRRVST